MPISMGSVIREHNGVLPILKYSKSCLSESILSLRPIRNRKSSVWARMTVTIRTVPVRNVRSLTMQRVLLREVWFILWTSLPNVSQIRKFLHWLIFIRWIHQKMSSLSQMWLWCFATSTATVKSLWQKMPAVSISWRLWRGGRILQTIFSFGITESTSTVICLLSLISILCRITSVHSATIM